jgi:hypothetical protein
MSEKEAGSVLTSENAEQFYANRLGLADDVQDVAVVEETPAEPVETEEQSGQEEIKATEEKKSNPKLEKRFSELTKQREQANQALAKEREAREALEARLSEYEKREAPQVVDENVEPQPSQFTDAFEYAKALAEYAAENALRNRDKQDAERKVADERSKVMQTWQQRIDATKAELPDYEEMITSSEVVVSDLVRDAIIESDVGPRILYYLAENPEIGVKLSSMSMSSALREIGKMEARFENVETAEKPAVARSKAPAPIKPLRSTSTNVDAGIDTNGEYHGTYQQWKQSRQAGKIR